MTDTPRRRLPYLVRLPLVLAAVVAALVIGYKVSHQQPAQVGPAAPSAPSAAAPAAAAPAAAAGTIGDGVWIVGTDIQPGAYRSPGAPAGGYCMWSRHSSTAGGPFDAITASDGSKTGPMLVTVQSADKLFRTHGCAPFTKIG